LSKFFNFSHNGYDLSDDGILFADFLFQFFQHFNEKVLEILDKLYEFIKSRLENDSNFSIFICLSSLLSKDFNSDFSLINNFLITKLISSSLVLIFSNHQLLIQNYLINLLYDFQNQFTHIFQTIITLNICNLIPPEFIISFLNNIKFKNQSDQISFFDIFVKVQQNSLSRELTIQALLLLSIENSNSPIFSILDQIAPIKIDETIIIT
jgi:hypothetical protein